MPLKERASCEAARREREKPRVSHSPCRVTALSLFREENFKKNLWDYSLKFIRLLPVVFPSQQQRSNRMKFRLLGQGYVTYRTAMNDPSVNSRVGFPYGRQFFESTFDWNISDQMIPYDNDIFQKILGKSLTWYKTLLSKPPPSSLASWPRYLWQPVS